MAARTKHRLVLLVVAFTATALGADAVEKWWQHGVVYQIYPRSFMDTNGDGIGDLKGITNQLAYLQDLGVAAVWLSPIYPSPQKDFGYDISDFKGVDHQYGTMADFEELLREAHSRGLKIILDIVPNHSSDKHTWFEQSENEKDGNYGKYYVWHDGHSTKKDPDHPERPAVPNNWLSCFRYSAWTWSEKRKQYYLHMFVKEQPDLNYRTTEVQDEMKAVFRFWMDKGVDGFRLDTVPHLVENNMYLDESLSNDPDCDLNDYCSLSHEYTENQPDTYELIQTWRELIDNHNKNVDRVMMTEAWASLDKTIAYYGNESNPGANFPFNFEMIQTLDKSSTASDFKKTIDGWMAEMNTWRWPNWVLGNHDKPRVASRYPNMADAMNMISMTLPGTAVTYNGEEMGMEDAFISWGQTKDPWAIAQGKDDYLKVSRDPNRTPMQWNDTINAGFSSAATTWMPVNPNYWKINIAQQSNSANSHLNIYKKLVKLRMNATVRKIDNLKTDVVQDTVLRLTRSLENADTIVTLVNFGSWEKKLSAADIGGSNLKVYVASDDSGLTTGQIASTGFTLRPKAGVVLTSGSAPRYE